MTPLGKHQLLLFPFLIAPVLADLGLAWFLDRRADGFTERPATLLSLREFPTSMDTGRHRRCGASSGSRCSTFPWRW